MTEETVSASHFRVHFKEIANAIAGGENACTVERHGHPMVVVVSLEDAEFLRKHKWGARKESPEKQAQPDTIRLIHPDDMPLEVLQEAYELTTDTTDFDIQSWRFKAYHSLRGRTGEFPAPWLRALDPDEETGSLPQARGGAG